MRRKRERKRRKKGTAKKMATTVAILLADGFETIEALAPIDVLTRGEADVVRVSCMEDKTVLSAQGIPVVCDTQLSDINLEDVDCLIIPGGMEGVNNLRKTAGVKEELERRMENDELTCAICAGPMLLAELDLLENRKATVYPGCDTDFPDGVRPKENGVYTDGNLITASGPAFALPFGFEIAKAVLGEETAKSLAEGMLA